MACLGYAKVAARADPLLLISRHVQYVHARADGYLRPSRRHCQIINTAAVAPLPRVHAVLREQEEELEERNAEENRKEHKKKEIIVVHVLDCSSVPRVELLPAGVRLTARQHAHAIVTYNYVDTVL